MQKVRIIVIAGSAIVAAYLLGNFTYAGLRVLELVVTSLALAVLYLASRSGRLWGPPVLFMALAGLAMALFDFRNFLDSMGSSLSPYLPYEFVTF